MFADETGFSLHPRLGRCWMRRGTRIRVPTTSAHRQRLNCFGWLAPLRGWHGLLRIPQGNTAGFLTLLRRLVRRFPTGRISLYVDGAAWHKGDPVDAFLADHPQVDLDYLPAYHPELNPVDRLWKVLRYAATTNRYFLVLDELWNSIRAQQRRWSPQMIMSVCSVT
ncbi:MAG: IS630 family transposase [Candidatus Methylomirabilales bacterium]